MAKKESTNNSLLTILLIVAGIFVISGGLTGNAITGNAWLDWFRIAPPSPTYEVTPTPSPSPEYLAPTETVYTAPTNIPIVPTYTAPTRDVTPVTTTTATTNGLSNNEIQNILDHSSVDYKLGKIEEKGAELGFWGRTVNWGCTCVCLAGEEATELRDPYGNSQRAWGKACLLTCTPPSPGSPKQSGFLTSSTCQNHCQTFCSPANVVGAQCIQQC